ncbi:MAG: hypothetical protein AAF404_09070 [Pseudomonadota bacterium]
MSIYDLLHGVISPIRFTPTQPTYKLGLRYGIYKIQIGSIQGIEMAVDNKKNAPSIDLMHERAREAGSELRRTLIGLASGGIGLLLVVFVSTEKHDYSLVQLFLIGSAVLTLTITVLFGLLAWRSDAQRNYFWALELDTRFQQHEKKNQVTRRKYQLRMGIADRVTRYMFIVAVVLIATFVLIRIRTLI